MSKGTFSLEDISPEALAKAIQIIAASSTPNRELVSEVVEPELKAIEEKTGTPSDPRFLGYAIEYLLRNR